jgi:hypothetical protein
MLPFLANHVIEIMCFAEHRAIVMAVIVLIMIQRAIRIIGNPDFLPIAILAIALLIRIGTVPT